MALTPHVYRLRAQSRLEACRRESVREGKRIKKPTIANLSAGAGRIIAPEASKLAMTHARADIALAEELRVAAFP